MTNSFLNFIDSQQKSDNSSLISRKKPKNELFDKLQQFKPKISHLNIRQAQADKLPEKSSCQYYAVNSF